MPDRRQQMINVGRMNWAKRNRTRNAEKERGSSGQKTDKNGGISYAIRD